MKSLFPVLIFFISILGVNAQEIDENRIQELNKLNLATHNLDLTDLQTQKDLHQIINFEKKRKTNKTLGIVFSASAALSLAAGSILLSEDHPTSNVVGGIMLTGGLIYAGVSIPFWVASKKRKKERDKLIPLYD